MVSKKQQRIDSYKRKQGFKEPHKSILIVAEGIKTEPIYFNSLKKKLRLPMINVEVVPAGAAPIIAKKSPTQVPYDIVYCVVDVEAPKADSLPKAVDKAKANNLEIILSNPCFEYWYLLHFRKTSSPFNTSQDVKSALRHEHPAYCESDKTIFDVVFDKTHEAIKRSKEVLNEQHNNTEDISNCNPSTHIHKIVENLLNSA
jgi:hypothetical protein